MYVMVDDAGRIVAASHNFSCGEGEVNVTPPEGFDLDSAMDWRLVDGQLVYDPLPELPEPEPENDAVATLQARVEELESVLELLLSEVEV